MSENTNYGITYWIYYIAFKLFEIVLFLFPAFPSSFYVRILVLMIYVISHILGVQTYYKQYKEHVLKHVQYEKNENEKENEKT